MIKEKGGKIYIEEEEVFVGVDESNHGAIPEYYAQVTSSFADDVFCRSRNSLEPARNHRGIHGRLSKRDFSILELQQHDLDSMAPIDRLGLILSSLMIGRVYLVDRLNIFVDGKIRPEFRRYTLDMVSDYLGLDSEKITLNHGSHFDSHYRIVWLADELANFSKRNPNSTLVQKSRKTLLSRYGR